jgi:hypothetical protein
VSFVAALASCAAIALPILLAPRSARANGRFPAANQLTATPGKPDALVLRTTFGLLVSNDGGANWDWVCERAVGYGGIWDPPIGVFGSGAVMAGTIDGLVLSPDHGCGWSYLTGALDKRAIVDVVVRPDAPAEGFALGSTSNGTDDAGASLFTTEVFATTDSGGTWSALASDFEPAFIAQTIEVARSDPSRVYLSGSLGDEGIVFVSSDGGHTFAKRSIPLEKPSERAPFLAAVDPSNAGRVYVRTGGATSRLLVSDDGADTFRSVFSGPPLRGFALSPDGARVWIGSETGLFAASASDLAFAQVSSAAVQCLFANDRALYACAGDTTLPYVVATSTDLGATFTPLLGLGGVRGPLACAPVAAAAICVPDWPALRATLDPTGGIADASAAPDATPLAAPAPAGGCDGCSAGGGGIGGVAATLGAWVIALTAHARRRRRSVRARGRE